MIILLFSKFKLLTLYALISFFISCATKPYTITPNVGINLNEMKIGFGSCLKQDKAMPIFDSIKRDNLDLFLMIGDNVYGDSEREDLKELKAA